MEPTHIIKFSYCTETVSPSLRNLHWTSLQVVHHILKVVPEQAKTQQTVGRCFHALSANILHSMGKLLVQHLYTLARVYLAERKCGMFYSDPSNLFHLLQKNFFLKIKIRSWGVFEVSGVLVNSFIKE